MGSHYSRSFGGKKFYDAMASAADSIIREFESLGAGFPVLCYTGFSGITTATMLAHYLIDDIRVEHLYVRKEDETHHGFPIEYSSVVDMEEAVPIFVDDFMESGSTVLYVMERVKQFWLGGEDFTGWPDKHDWYGFRYLLKEDLEMVEGDEYGYNAACFIPHIFAGEKHDTRVSFDLYDDLWYDEIKSWRNRNEG